MIKLEEIKWRVCNSCPCLNTDIENGSSCNLEYESESYETSKDWLELSPNCKLESIKHSGKVFTPEILSNDTEIKMTLYQARKIKKLLASCK